MQVSNPLGYAAAATTGTAATSASSSTGSTASSGGLSNPNLFISLLAAQLKAQDPLNPMSPTDMVNQLTQVSSLQQLVNINQTLTNMSKVNQGTTPSNPAPKTSTPAA